MMIEIFQTAQGSIIIKDGVDIVELSQKASSAVYNHIVDANKKVKADEI